MPACHLCLWVPYAIQTHTCRDVVCIHPSSIDLCPSRCGCSRVLGHARGALPFPRCPLPFSSSSPLPAGAYSAGLITEEQRCDIVRKSCPGPGACGGMYTANTMASSIEAMGMTLPYSSSIPAVDELKKDECRMAGRYMLELLKKDLKPRDIMSRK